MPVVVVVVIVVVNGWLPICFNSIAYRYTKVFKTFQKLNALPVPCYAGFKLFLIYFNFL